MEKQNVTGARKGVCLVSDRELRRKKAMQLGRWGERTPSKRRRRGLTVIPKK